jgi:MFS family permease
MTSRVESFFDHGVVNRGWLATIAGTIGLTLGPSTLTLVSFGVFVRPLQQEFGRTLGQTTFAATIISYAAMVVALVQGMLTDRFGSRVLIVASIPIFALSYASLCFLPRNLAVYYAFWIIIPVCAIGILIVGAEFDALSYIIPRYYGYRSFGTTYGGVYAVFQLGAGLGIAAVGFSRDWLGSFRPSMWALAILTLLAGLLFSRLGPYRFPAGKLGAATAGTESASGAGNRG